MMQQPPKKKRVGEMGKPDNSAAFDKSMQEQFMSRKKGDVGTEKPETRAEAEARERGQSPEDMKAKARKQIMDKKMMEEKLRQGKSDKSVITKTMRALFGGK
jgi:hypothetical protein